MNAPLLSHLRLMLPAAAASFAALDSQPRHFPRASTGAFNRIAFSAAHVVADARTDSTGLQDHFIMVGGQQSARSLVHLAELFRLADRAGLLRDPELAHCRMRRMLALHGITRCATSHPTSHTSRSTRRP
jgi:hypothetical protein